MKIKLYCEWCKKKTKKYYRIKESYMVGLDRKIRVKYKLCKACFKQRRKN